MMCSFCRRTAVHSTYTERGAALVAFSTVSCFAAGDHRGTKNPTKAAQFIRTAVKVDTISEAKAQLSALVDRALAGEEVIIGRAG
jgi:hypothetical protein